MNNEGRILFLTLHTFSLTGGIEKVCRVFSKILTNLLIEKAVGFKSLKVLSLCDQPHDINLNYCRQQDFKGFAYHRWTFSVVALFNGLTSDTIVLSHVNLLSIAYVIKFVSREKRIILFAHGIEVWRTLSPWKRRFLQRHVEIWAVSHFTSEVLQLRHGISGAKVKILNNCLDPYFDLPRDFVKPSYLLERYGLARAQPVVLTLSRVSSFELYKGYDHIIASIPKLLHDFPKLVYILAGQADPSEKLRLAQLITDTGVENHVMLAGFIPDRELVDFFLLADVFVMPSKKEGFGIVFIEAAACGCAIIAGNQDGSRDALLNGALGALIDPDDHESLSATISTSLHQNRDMLSKQLQQQKCLSHFGHEHYQTRVKELLNA